MSAHNATLVAHPVRWRRISKCRACGGVLNDVFCDLGAQPLANAYVDAATAPAVDPRIPLRALVCAACRLVQLDTIADASSIFGDYAYLSSVSASWVRHAADFCRAAMARMTPDFVVALASNDGYLLQHFVAAGVRCLGVEPAANVAALAREKGVDTLVRFFGIDAADEIVARHGRASLIVANNVLAHVPDVNDFVAGMARLLAPRGYVSVECPMVTELARNVQFDTIYHEHYAYWSLHALEAVLARHGLAVCDVERLPTHGGSMRVIARHAADVEPPTPALAEMRAMEAAAGVARHGFYTGFGPRVGALLDAARRYLEECRQQGLVVAAYGAAAKGNTFLNALGPAAHVIDCVADANPLKAGKLLPGTRIPIVTPAEMASRKPDVVLLLAWNLADEILPALARLGLTGARMVTAVPRLNVREIRA
jgi:SAM-dependent methyltransferase